MKISKITGMPEQIPSIASDKINLRLKPITKLGIRKLAAIRKQSMSKSLIEILEYYYQNVVPNNFWNDIYDYSWGVFKKTTVKDSNADLINARRSI